MAATTGWHTVNVNTERLGHASVGIIVGTYSHMMPEMDRHLVDVILGA